MRWGGGAASGLHPDKTGEKNCKRPSSYFEVTDEIIGKWSTVSRQYAPCISNVYGNGFSRDAGRRSMSDDAAAPKPAGRKSESVGAGGIELALRSVRLSDA